jgi:general secretion pathway protein G
MSDERWPRTDATDPPRQAGRGEGGFTYLELIAATAILMILASAILPLARVARIRQREIELRRELRVLRTAIDRYHQAVEAGQIGGTDVKLGSEGYPPDLETLVKGGNQVGAVNHKLKYLRRIPVDPMTGKPEWGLRCYQDDPDATSWCGQNVFDVYTTSTGKALDGTQYKEW